MSRVLQLLTPHRAAVGVSSAVGWALGIQITRGGFDTESGLWAAIAVLALIQLRLLLPPKSAA